MHGLLLSLGEQSSPAPSTGWSLTGPAIKFPPLQANLTQCLDDTGVLRVFCAVASLFIIFRQARTHTWHSSIHHIYSSTHGLEAVNVFRSVYIPYTTSTAATTRYFLVRACKQSNRRRYVSSMHLPYISYPCRLAEQSLYLQTRTAAQMRLAATAKPLASSQAYACRHHTGKRIALCYSAAVGCHPKNGLSSSTLRSSTNIRIHHRPEPAHAPASTLQVFGSRHDEKNWSKVAMRTRNSNTCTRSASRSGYHPSRPLGESTIAPKVQEMPSNSPKQCPYRGPSFTDVTNSKEVMHARKMRHAVRQSGAFISQRSNATAGERWHRKRCSKAACPASLAAGGTSLRASSKQPDRMPHHADARAARQTGD